jgi:hypothetical protein
MNEAQITHARRALACPRWRWMAGMLAHFEHDGRYTRVSMPDAWFSTTALPDLTDPATLGCLLALVREAWRCPTAYVRQSTTRRQSDGVIAWEVCDLYLDAEACRALGVPREGSVGSWGHGSEAEALVAALESAP